MKFTATKHFSMLLQNRILQHFLFWAASFYFLLSFFAEEEQFSEIDVVYTSLFHISLVIGVYVNTIVGIGILLKKEQYLLYLFLFVTLLFTVAYLNEFTFEKLSDLIAPDYLFISSYSIKELIKFSFIYLALSSLLKLSKSWFENLEKEKQLEKLKREQVETELNVLKTNINPHFLFNNLTSLYALSRKNSEQTSDYILKLSDLMRYMIYETKDKWVSLEQELSYIVNYLDLQKLRCQNQTQVSYSIEGEVRNQKIVPFLLIPFVENSFKHGGFNQIGLHVIDLKINVNRNQLQMNLRNSIAEEKQKEKIGGFGIENVKTRLDTLYQDNYYLLMEEKEEEYLVELKLNLEI